MYFVIARNLAVQRLAVDALGGTDTWSQIEAVVIKLGNQICFPQAVRESYVECTSKYGPTAF